VSAKKSCFRPEEPGKMAKTDDRSSVYAFLMSFFQAILSHLEKYTKAVTSQGPMSYSKYRFSPRSNCVVKFGPYYGKKKKKKQLLIILSVEVSQDPR